MNRGRNSLWILVHIWKWIFIQNRATSTWLLQLNQPSIELKLFITNCPWMACRAKTICRRNSWAILTNEWIWEFGLQFADNSQIEKKPYETYWINDLQWNICSALISVTCVVYGVRKHFRISCGSYVSTNSLWKNPIPCRTNIRKTANVTCCRGSLVKSSCLGKDCWVPAVSLGSSEEKLRLEISCSCWLQ